MSSGGMTRRDIKVCAKKTTALLNHMSLSFPDGRVLRKRFCEVLPDIERGIRRVIANEHAAKTKGAATG